MIKSQHSQSDQGRKLFVSNSLLESEVQMKELQQQHFNSTKKNNSSYTNTKSVNKAQPCTQKSGRNNMTKDPATSINQFIKNLQERNFIIDNSIVRTDRDTLLQKRKSYAQSIRQKNKLQLRQNQQKSRTKKLNDSMNVSYTFTPPKDIKILEKEMTQIQKQYYSLKKHNNNNNDNNSRVFKQTNTNRQNEDVFAGMDLGKLQKSGLTNNKLTNSGIGQISTNRQSYSQRKNYNNKENKLTYPNPSVQKKPTSKCTSYAQIFDKKTTMNALINHQKGKGLVINSGSRQVNSIKKQKNSLKSMMATPQSQLNNYEYGMMMNEFPSSLDNMDCNINGFVCEQFVQRIQDISRINYQTQSKQLQNECPPLPTDQTSKLSLHSQTIQQTIDNSFQYQKQRKQQQKQIMTLAKQNATFKRQLATFRKQNSSIKKELENCKKYIQQLQEKAKKFIEEQQDKLNNDQETLLLSSQALQSTQSNTQLPLKLTNKISDTDSNLQQILQSTEQQLFSLKSNNKALQLKVYMLQKRLVHEQQLNKKRLALEVNNWREKYNKLRNQHLKFKNSLTNPFLNSDWSISMDISRDD